jgi:hypothetical protein
MKRPHSSIESKSFASGASAADKHRDKALLYVKVNFGDRTHETGVYREDTANIVAERLIKLSGVFPGNTAERRTKVRELALLVEEQVNLKIERMCDEVKRYKTEVSKIQFAMSQLQREKRLEQAAKSTF